MNWLTKKAILILTICGGLAYCNSPKREIITAFQKFKVELPNDFEIIKSENSPAFGDLIIIYHLKINDSNMSNICKSLRLKYQLSDSIYDNKFNIAKPIDKELFLTYRTNKGYKIEYYKSSSDYYRIEIDTLKNELKYLYVNE